MAMNIKKFVEYLHVEHGAYLLKCLYRYGVPQGECEDVRQDIYLRLLTAKPTLNTSAMRGLCARLAHNAAVDFRRARSRQITTVPWPYDDDPLAVIIEQRSYDAWKATVATSRIEDVEEAFLLTTGFNYECAPDVPMIEILFDLVDGRSHEDIGERFGVNFRTIAKWLHDWREWIKQQQSISEG